MTLCLLSKENRLQILEEILALYFDKIILNTHQHSVGILQSPSRSRHVDIIVTTVVSGTRNVVCAPSARRIQFPKRNSLTSQNVGMNYVTCTEHISINVCTMEVQLLSTTSSPFCMTAKIIHSLRLVAHTPYRL